MRKTRTLLLLVCLAVMSTVWAESINESQALGIASRFMSSHARQATSLKLALKTPRMNAQAGSVNAAYYVFNADRGGYVIVAGDDRAPAVLGYSETGTFDTQNVPEAMQDLLEGYAAQIEALEHGAVAAVPLMSNKPIRPLVQAVWSQNNPYNILLPYLPTGKHVYTGCVATAMAQVMHYWKWPARPTMPIPAYTSTYTSSSQELTYEMPELPIVDFDWDAMQNTYQTTDTASAAALAAARLTLYCAQSVEMNFKPSSSGAVTGTIPLKAATYFDYDASAHMESRARYSTQEWASLIYGEIAAGRPVIFSGSKKSSGHAFICDGYDGNGMYHINWGWNGNSNGYFLLNVLNPDEQGTGSADGAYGYIYSQAAIVGFQPNKGGSHIFELTAAEVKLDSFEGIRESTNDPFLIYVSGKFHNYTSDTIAVRFGWGLFQDGVMIDRLYSSYSTGLRPGYLFTHTNRELEFGEGITSGTYLIMPMYSEYGQDNWRPCASAERNYIEVTIDGNTCTATGYGTAGTPNYVVNGIDMIGYMHNGRPIDINVNLTNNGVSSNELLHMFINGTFVASGYAGIEPGETGDVHYTYLFENAGNYTITWSWNTDGSDPIASSNVTINPMPAANLSATISILDVTDSSNKIITSDKFSVKLTITNNGTTTYDEDISAKLFKNTQGTSGTSVQGINQHLVLAPGETTTMQFDMTNVADGWRYFIKTYFYTEGVQTSLKGTSTYTIVFPEMPEVVPGDVNGDGQLTIKDVTALISYLMGDTPENFVEDNADVNEDGPISIKDVTALISKLMGGE